ncbi:hypothetical protein ACHRV5_04915 [Flavobacterium sp. FlaQc-52]|jgi:hypothetical protein|uniref:hypothetical protein n=1 Tax=Flavobacterium sp. FlaQc-52 TaxID=3374185 RepID=UPI003757C731
MMRKYACLLLFALILNGCDDGDVTVETLDFSDIKQASSCPSSNNQLVYKIKSQESLLLQLDKDTFKNEPTLPGKPNTYQIDDNKFKLYYRSYDGPVGIPNICDFIPPTTPNVINEWYAKSGRIEIATTAITSTNSTTNAITITGYSHNIVIKNITYSVSSLDITQPQVVFGDFTTTVADVDKLDLAFTRPLVQCPVSKQIYTYNTKSAMTIDAIDPLLIKNEVTAANSPRRGLIGSSVNKLLYKLFTGPPVSDDYFCGTTIPTTPTVKETWTGVDGVANTSGIIEVTTTTAVNNQFKHTIVLKNTSIKKGNNFVNLGTSYVLGELLTK